MSTHPLHPGQARSQPAPPPFSWRAAILSIWESEGVLSSRLIAGFIVAMFGLGIQCWALWYWSKHADLSRESREMIEHFVDADFIFSGSLFGIGTAKIIASRFSPKPTVDPTQQQKQDESTT